MHYVMQNKYTQDTMILLTPSDLKFVAILILGLLFQVVRDIILYRDNDTTNFKEVANGYT